MSQLHFVPGRVGGDHGMTLVEVLVAASLFLVLITLAFTIVMSGSSNVNSVRQTTDLNEEARLVLNRISRELRQAQRITSAPGMLPVNPDATNPLNGTDRICPAPSPCFNPNGDVAITFEVDFNRNGIIEPSAGDAERITYRWEPASKRLLLQTSAETTPILAANVESFKITYRSSNYRCDTNSDGEVTWQELESAASPPCPAGGSANSTLDTEVQYIDRVTIDMSVLTPPRTQHYRTRVDLRNNLANIN